MTPQAAVLAGASYVVIGRPITEAWAQGAQAMTTAARTIAEDILQ
jgi:orotidine-5'-phosphate decarboxylase